MVAIKILIADAHTLFTQALKYLLEMDEEFQVVAEATDGQECLEKISEQKPDLLIIEPFVWNKCELHILKELKSIQQTNRLKVLVLTGHEEIHYIMDVLQYDMNGYILKSSDHSELKKAIHKIISDGFYIQPEIKKELDEKGTKIKHEIDKMNSLTKREQDILKHLSTGMYNKEIALKLEISERTVKNHVSNIFKKIGVADRTQAAVFAIRNYLFDIYE